MLCLWLCVCKLTIKTDTPNERKKMQYRYKQSHSDGQDSCKSNHFFGFSASNVMCERIKLHVWSLKCLIGNTLYVQASMFVMGLCGRIDGRSNDINVYIRNKRAMASQFRRVWERLCVLSYFFFRSFTGDFVRFVIAQFDVSSITHVWDCFELRRALPFPFSLDLTPFAFLSLARSLSEACVETTMLWFSWAHIFADQTDKNIFCWLLSSQLFIKIIMSIFAFLFPVFAIVSR